MKLKTLFVIVGLLFTFQVQSKKYTALNALNATLNATVEDYIKEHQENNVSLETLVATEQEKIIKDLTRMQQIIETLGADSLTCEYARQTLQHAFSEATTLGSFIGLLSIIEQTEKKFCDDSKEKIYFYAYWEPVVASAKKRVIQHLPSHMKSTRKIMDKISDKQYLTGAREWVDGKEYTNH